MARQYLDPLKILVSDLIFSILAGNKKKYIVSNEFEFGQTAELAALDQLKKIFYLLENYLNILVSSQGTIVALCATCFLFSTRRFECVSTV